jgi:hypothetical protein
VCFTDASDTLKAQRATVPNRTISTSTRAHGGRVAHQSTMPLIRGPRQGPE